MGHFVCGSLTKRQIVSGFNFLINAPCVSGLAETVIRVDHRHAGPTQIRIAQSAASIVCLQLHDRYEGFLPLVTLGTEPLETPSAYTRAGLICELASIYMVCSVRNSWSVLEMASRNDILSGLRPGVQNNCAESWAQSLLDDTGTLDEKDPEIFMKMCMSGAVRCLTYCRFNGRHDPFWAECDWLYEDRGATGFTDEQ
jgi:hypothetical protein